MKSADLITVVLPVFNEEEGIELFHRTVLKPALDQISEYEFEIVYVDDGSSDGTRLKIAALSSEDATIRCVTLSRNFGKETAISAGVSFAHGDAVLILDSDGQHPPTSIPQFIEKWKDGAQVVIGIRMSNQKEGFVKRLGSRVFYALLNSLSTTPTVPRSTDFRLLDREVYEEFLKLNEPNRISRGLIDWLGYQRDFVEFHSPARLAGKATYSLSGLVRLAINSFTTMSLRPLFVFGYLGMFITALTMLLGIFIAVEQYLLGDPLNLNVTGSGALGVLVAFLVGLVLTAQGVMAVYISHIHAQTQLRPLFIVNRRDSIGIDAR